MRVIYEFALLGLLVRGTAAMYIKSGALPIMGEG